VRESTTLGDESQVVDAATELANHLCLEARAGSADGQLDASRVREVVEEVLSVEEEFIRRGFQIALRQVSDHLATVEARLGGHPAGSGLLRPSSDETAPVDFPAAPSSRAPAGPRPDLGKAPTALVAEPEGAGPGPRVPPSQRSTSVAFSCARWAGVVLVLFVVWALYGTSVFQRWSQHALRSQVRSSAVAPGSAVPTAPGHALGVLDISRLGIHQVVIEGASRGDLERGPGRVTSSAPPGSGLTVVVGHRTTFGAPFRALGGARVGDEITMTTSTASYRYRVTGPPASGYAIPTADRSAGLLLVSADPAYQSQSYLMVRASPEPGIEPGQVAVLAPSLPLVLPGRHGSLLALIGGLLLALVVAVGLGARRIVTPSLPRWAAVSLLPAAALLVWISYGLLLRGMSPLL